MARARNLKPSFFMNETLAECDPLARLLFAGLWTIADREGRLEDRPKKIKAELLPYDDCNCESLLSELYRHGFILRYVVGESRFIQVVNFNKHQNPHVKEAESTIPAPDSPGASTVPAGPLPLTLLPLTPSLNPHPSTGEPSAPPPVRQREKPPPKYTPEFEQFWAFCPRTSCSKFEAHIAYQKAILNGVTHGQLRSSIEAYGTFVVASGSPAAHATTWLNNRRWEVDYDAALSQRKGIRPAGSSANDPAATARDIGEDIIAKRRAARDAGLATSPPQEQPPGSGRTHPTAVPDLCQPEGIW